MDWRLVDWAENGEFELHSLRTVEAESELSQFTDQELCFEYGITLPIDKKQLVYAASTIEAEYLVDNEWITGVLPYLIRRLGLQDGDFDLLAHKEG